MDLAPERQLGSVSKTESELVEIDKQEYKLVGSFIRTKGLRIYCYNPLKEELKEVDVKYRDTAKVDFNKDGFDISSSNVEATIDTRQIHFEALNLRTAQNRVKKWKSGKIDDLCNLKKPTKGTISIF